MNKRNGQLKRFIKRRDPLAKALSSGAFRQRIVKSKKLYNRKGRNCGISATLD